MTSLSGGGFCVRLPALATVGIAAEDRLINIRLEHPDFPSVVVQGRVAYLLGGPRPSSDGTALVGVQFLNPSYGFARFIADFVARHQPENLQSA